MNLMPDQFKGVACAGSLGTYELCTKTWHNGLARNLRGCHHSLRELEMTSSWNEQAARPQMGPRGFS
jgi:hypothetical protein